MKRVVLSVLAHPDDAEFLCAGTLTRLAQAGWEVHIASMTPGDCGSAELPPEKIAAVRRKEGVAAAALIGASYHCIEERDLLVTYCEPTIEKVTRLMRQVRASVVLTHAHQDYHLDHEMTSTVVRGASFAAAVPNFQVANGMPPPLDHIPHLYYCDPIGGMDPLGREVAPGQMIDISGVIATKEAMLAAHASQRDWLMKHHGMDQYLQVMRDWSAHCGKLAGVAYAEGFRQHRGHSYPQDDILSVTLGGR
jgi:LmbE family N-acetylglucosaminyl deacetylase